MPQTPLKPWTATAPTGSSSFRVFSTKRAAQTTRTPATEPIRTATGAVTKAQGAVMATRPARRPLMLMEGSGFLNFHHVKKYERQAPAPEASIVLTATTEIRRSVPESVEPELKPNQPNARMKQPRKAIGRLCPGIACATPLTYFPIRGPRTISPVTDITPPVRWITPDPAKSTYP